MKFHKYPSCGIALLHVVRRTDGRTVIKRSRGAFRNCFASVPDISCSSKDGPMAEIHLLEIHVMKSVLGQRSERLFPEDNNLAVFLRMYKKFRTCRKWRSNPPPPRAANIPYTIPSTLARLWKPDSRHWGIRYGFHVLRPSETRGNTAGDVLRAPETKCIPVTVNLLRDTPPVFLVLEISVCIILLRIFHTICKLGRFRDTLVAGVTWEEGARQTQRPHVGEFTSWRRVLVENKRIAELVLKCPSSYYFPECFCQRLSRSQGHSAAGRTKTMQNPGHSIMNLTRDLLACSAVSQPTAPPRIFREISSMYDAWFMTSAPVWNPAQLTYSWRAVSRSK
jgi:hypothetical protein